MGCVRHFWPKWTLPPTGESWIDRQALLNTGTTSHEVAFLSTGKYSGQEIAGSAPGTILRLIGHLSLCGSCGTGFRLRRASDIEGCMLDGSDVELEMGPNCHASVDLRWESHGRRCKHLCHARYGNGKVPISCISIQYKAGIGDDFFIRLPCVRDIDQPGMYLGHRCTLHYSQSKSGRRSFKARS